MVKNSCVLGIAFCVLTAGNSLFGQEPTPVQPGNNEIINMLRANMPESTTITEIAILAGRGANFDISPAAMIDLQRNGASEKVLNTVIWAQTTIVPGVSVPLPRAVFYRTGANSMKLNSFLLWAEFDARWTAWPFYKTGAQEVALHASPGVVQISESSPTLLVQGFDPAAGWQLVAITRGADYREVKLKRKHLFSSDFFSDSAFERADLRAVTLSPEGDRSFTIKPAAPLGPGDYALCGQVPNGGWMRACYEFQVTGM